MRPYVRYSGEKPAAVDATPPLPPPRGVLFTRLLRVTRPPSCIVLLCSQLEKERLYY